MYLVSSENPLQKINTINRLSELLRVNVGHLLYICYKRSPSENYNIFQIRKKRGGFRQITASRAGLKLIQERLAELLSSHIQFKDCVYGFIKGKGIRFNAEKHKKSAWVLNIDIKDFFTTINFGRVRSAFIAKPFEMEPRVATIIAQICVHCNSLPQGAPSSPVISNIIGSYLDSKIINLIKKYKLSYTRYVDDITISSRKAFPHEIAYIIDGETIVGDELLATVKKSGFEINTSKSRLQSRYSRQEVTGLVVNKKVNINRQYRDGIRAAIKQWTNNIDDRELRNNIYGRLSFMSMIKGTEDPTYIRLILKMIKHDESPPLFTQKIKEMYNMYDVFICHASEDKKEIAQPLYDELSNLGLNVFLDNKVLEWGDSLPDKIGRALTKSKYVVAVMTENSVGKKWPKKEINAVLSNEINSGEKKLLPLVYGDEKNILNEFFLLNDKLYEKWNKNPQEIAKKIHLMVMK